MVSFLANPGPIWNIVTAEGVVLGVAPTEPAGEPAPAEPAGDAATVPSGVHESFPLSGRIDSILPQRSQSPAAGPGACASATDAPRAAARATRRCVVFLPAEC